MAIDSANADDIIASSLWNQIASFVNGTTGGETPGKFVRLNSPSVYGVTIGNQDTTNGLALKVQYGDVANPTTIFTADKTNGLQIATRLTTAFNGAIEARLRDKGGLVFSLDAYADGVVINTGVNDTDAAWTAAFAAVTAAGGGTVVLGPGIYLAATAGVTNWPDHCTIRGAGMDATVIKHRDTSAREPIRFADCTGSGVMDLTVDGNRINNNNATTGFVSSEISIDGTQCFAIRCKVTDFNYLGITCGGVGNVVAYCRIEGPALGTPTSAAYTAFPTTDIGGSMGILQSLDSYSRDTVVYGNTVTGLRGPAIVLGGIRIVIANNVTRDCHRFDSPAGVGGGHIALVGSTSPVGDLDVPAGGLTLARECLIMGNSVGPTWTSNGSFNASGIELDSCSDVHCIGNVIDSVQGFGFTLNATERITISGGSVRNAGVAGFRASNGTRKFSVSDVHFLGCYDGVLLGGATDYFSFKGCTFEGSVHRNWNTAGSPASALTGTSWSAQGNVIVGVSSTVNNPIPEIAARFADDSYAGYFANGHAAGHGLLVQGGATASQYALRVQTYNGIDLLTVLSTGVTSITGDLTTPGLVYATPTSPTLSQSASLTFTQNYFRAKVLGKKCHLQGSFSITSTGTANNAIQVTVPAAYTSARTGGAAVIGTAVYVDSLTTVRTGALVAATGTGFQIQCDGKLTALGTAGDALTAASGDTIAFDCTYELA